MSNSWFQFKQFKINQEKTAMKVGVDGVLLGAVSHFGNAEKILDIGAGTGLLSLMTAQRTNAEITALEIEKDAYNQCVENVKLNKQERRIEVVRNSFQEYCIMSKTKFDFIICNPPFFENSQKSKLKNRNIARHSDSLSKEEIIKGVSNLLNPEGIFSIILPTQFEQSFENLCNNYGLFCNYKLKVKPKNTKAANRIISEFSYVKKNVFTEILILRENNTNQYTKAYKELTKDFYLNF